MRDETVSRYVCGLGILQCSPNLIAAFWERNGGIEKNWKRTGKVRRGKNGDKFGLQKSCNVD